MTAVVKKMPLSRIVPAVIPHGSEKFFHASLCLFCFVVVVVEVVVEAVVDAAPVATRR